MTENCSKIIIMCFTFVTMTSSLQDKITNKNIKTTKTTKATHIKNIKQRFFDIFLRPDDDSQSPACS